MLVRRRLSQPGDSGHVSLIDLIYRRPKSSNSVPSNTSSDKVAKSAITASVKGEGRRGRYKWLDMNSVAAAAHTRGMGSRGSGDKGH